MQAERDYSTNVNFRSITSATHPVFYTTEIPTESRPAQHAFRFVAGGNCHDSKELCLKAATNPILIPVFRMHATISSLPRAS